MDTLMLDQEFDTYLTKLEGNCQERQLRDPSYVNMGEYGEDDVSGSGFDSVDFAVFMDHGWARGLEFETWEPDKYLHEQNVLWGNTDLEWAYILACEWHDSYDATRLHYDKAQMAGAHGICGFGDEMAVHYTIGDPTPIQSGGTRGRILPDILRAIYGLGSL